MMWAIEWGRNEALSASVWHLTMVTWLLAMVATVASWYAARHGILELRRLHAATAILGLIFVGLYTAILWTSVAPTQWNTWVRAPALMSWVLVWCWPAIVSVQLRHKLQKTVQRSRHLEE